MKLPLSHSPLIRGGISSCSGSQEQQPERTQQQLIPYGSYCRNDSVSSKTPARYNTTTLWGESLCIYAYTTTHHFTKEKYQAASHNNRESFSLYCLFCALKAHSEYIIMCVYLKHRSGFLKLYMRVCNGRWVLV